MFSSVENEWYRDLSATGVPEKKAFQSSAKMWFNAHLTLKVSVF